jgi:hypothetical protein
VPAVAGAQEREEPLDLDGYLDGRRAHVVVHVLDATD